MTVPVLAAVVVAAMILEARVSTAHDRQLRARGAIEPPGDVFKAMQIAYPGAFVLMLAEGVWRGVTIDRAFGIGVVIFAVAKLLKYWAIATLGDRWTFRVLVPPGSVTTRSGPYRWLRHPNYLAVAGELAGIAIAAHAVVTGIPAVAGFGWLMLKRVGIEERALGQAQ